MVDVVDTITRSKMMANISGAHTKPEMAVRRFLHTNGFRFRLHQKNLPGKPDIVLKKYNLAVFVNGCFWHRHESCFYATTPATRKEFWVKKLENNSLRDEIKISLLLDKGWRVITIWECGIKHAASDMNDIINYIFGKDQVIEWPKKPPRKMN